MERVCAGGRIEIRTTKNTKYTKGNTREMQNSDPPNPPERGREQIRTEQRSPPLCFGDDVRPYKGVASFSLRSA